MAGSRGSVSPRPTVFRFEGAAMGDVARRRRRRRSSVSACCDGLRRSIFLDEYAGSVSKLGVTDSWVHELDAIDPMRLLTAYGVVSKVVVLAMPIRAA